MIFLIFLFIQTAFAGFTPEAFVDTYYMWDFQRPQKRAFTTQPLRHDRPSVNLAHLGGRWETKYWRSRFALQAGDSVERNTSLEPGKEKYIQEAYVGYQLKPGTWLDGGIYLGHIGMESWISKDNPTYSRSLMLDYVPYYATGLRLDHQLSHHSGLQLHLMQGWQIVSETNRAKSVGFQYRWNHFTYNNFLGDEKVYPHEMTRFRHYHNFIFKINSVTAAFDIGQEADDTWGSLAGVWTQALNETQSLAYRLEHYFDPKGANVGNRLITQSASLNFDQKIRENVLWRSELRGFLSEDKIYPDRDNKLHHWDAFAVTSLAVSI